MGRIRAGSRVTVGGQVGQGSGSVARASGQGSGSVRCSEATAL